MKNIDKELIAWAMDKIETDYKDDVALLIGQRGACKIPTDEQNLAFDFYVPCTEKGYQLAQTFIIEGMGYDLFPMSFQRLEGIADLQETITFALMEGEVLYARTKEDESRFIALQELVRKRLADPKYRVCKAFEQLDVAMDIYKNLAFNEKMGDVRKAAGGVMQYLSIAIATFNGTYLKRQYGSGQYGKALENIDKKPQHYQKLCEEIVYASTIEEIKDKVYKLINETRKFFASIKQPMQEERNENIEELAGWYYEMRYSLRRLAYFCEVKDPICAYELGCYIQIEYDAIKDEFELMPIDLMGSYEASDLSVLLLKANLLEEHVLERLKNAQCELRIYEDLESFLKAQK